MTETATISALPIPAKYAGIQFALLKNQIKVENQEFVARGGKSADLEILTIEGQRYSLQSGYLVPYYLPLSPEFSKRAEELTLDRIRRFFYTAEPELDVRWTRDEINKALTDYKNCRDPDTKRIKARYVVGHIVNRIERLARIYFHANLDSGEISLSEAQLQGLHTAQQPLADLQTMRRIRKMHDLSQEEAKRYDDLEKPLIIQIREALKPIRDEVAEYNKLLTMDEPELVDAVRRRDRSTDHDGILEDLIREMSKVWGIESLSAERLAREGILQKIGESMEAIDETSNILDKLLRNSITLNSLRNAKDRYAESVSEDRQSIHDLLEGGASKLLQEFTQLCRARVGIRSEDSKNFGYVRERAALIDDVIHEIHKNLRSIGRSTKQSEISELRDLLSDGFNLMYDMSQVRIPRNRNAPTESPDRLSINSVAQFNARTDAWLESHKDQSQGPAQG